MADKTLTIKTATDKELDDLIIRLRKENEAQSIIADIKRRSSSGYVPYDYAMEVSTEKPIESLYHYGILGMKWGKRKVSSLSTVPHNVSDDHVKKMSIRGKKVHELTNAELKAFNERAQLEKQFKELTKAQVGPVEKFVKDTISSIGKEVATNYLKKYANKGMDELMKKTAKKAVS